jgi:serine/threonine protein kinase
LRAVFSRLQPEVVPRDKAMRIIAGMCRGLAHAHGRGLAHADFKPGNVILTAGDEPKILDFGLSQAAAPSGRTGDVSIKPAGESLRAITPAYASCNRLEGGAPGFSDDVYSLSCVIYELLAGHHPYDRKSALVARELNLKPDRIDGLTEIQWRTLATGLRPLRDARTTEVYDLLDAFTAPTPARALSVPVEKKKGREKPDVSPLIRVVAATVLIAAIVMLGFELVPSKYPEVSLDAEGGAGTAIAESASPRPTAVNEKAALQAADDQLSAPIPRASSWSQPSISYRKTVLLSPCRSAGRGTCRGGQALSGKPLQIPPNHNLTTWTSIGVSYSLPREKRPGPSSFPSFQTPLQRATRVFRLP